MMKTGSSEQEMVNATGCIWQLVDVNDSHARTLWGKLETIYAFKFDSDEFYVFVIILP